MPKRAAQFDHAEAARLVADRPEEQTMWARAKEIANQLGATPNAVYQAAYRSVYGRDYLGHDYQFVRDDNLRRYEAYHLGAAKRARERWRAHREEVRRIRAERKRRVANLLKE